MAPSISAPEGVLRDIALLSFVFQLVTENNVMQSNPELFLQKELGVTGFVGTPRLPTLHNNELCIMTVMLSFA